MKIYITRHGETIWNKEGKIQGWNDSELTQKGIENAKRLGERLKHIDFGCIYCSPSGRAVDTAKCIRGEKDTPIITKESLKEMGFGSWEGMEHSKVKELYPLQQFNLWNKPHLYKPVDGEHFEDVLSRARQILYDIINNSKHKNVMVVSHAILIKAIFAIVKNYSLEDFWNPPFLEGTSLSVFEVKDRVINVILEADVSHME